MSAKERRPETDGPSPGPEYRLDRPFEQRGDREGQREAGLVALGLNGVHRLSRDMQLCRQFALGPSSLGPKRREIVPHRERMITYSIDRLKTLHPNRLTASMLRRGKPES